MIALALLADVAPGVNVARDDWIEMQSRFECTVAPASPSELERVIFLFPRDQQAGDPQVWVFETYRNGFSALSRTSASSLPAPSSRPAEPPVFRPVIVLGKSVFETLSPASETGNRWSYKRTDAAGSDKPVVTRGQCRLVMEDVRVR